MSSPGAPSSSPQIPSRPTPVKSPYEWMKKPSYQSQPNPGKTRTKDKYRVVYTDHQRLELEKEFHYTRYITIRRKAELAQALGLSERQVKIWFQNRRAKDRKQKKKIDAGIPISMNGQTILTQSHVNSSSNPHSNLSSLLDVKPKLEQSLHLQHLHQMSAMGMNMSQMGLHPHLHSHLPPPMPPTSSASHPQSSPSPMLMN
jgi:homeobox protein CDX